MKVRAVITYDFSEDDRRAISDYYGQATLQTRQELKDILKQCGVGWAESLDIRAYSSTYIQEDG